MNIAWARFFSAGDATVAWVVLFTAACSLLVVFFRSVKAPACAVLRTGELNGVRSCCSGGRSITHFGRTVRRRHREPERISRTLLLMFYLPLVSSPPSLCRGLLAFASYFWLNAASLLPHLTKQSMTWVYLSRGGEGVGVAR